MSGEPQRRRSQQPVRLLFEKFTSFVEEYASCLSLGGMFVRTADLREIGDSVGFEIALSDGFQLARGVGEVVWRRSADGGVGRPAGMAIRFTALDQQGRDLILKILEEQVRGGGEPFEIDATPPDAETAPALESFSFGDRLEDTEDPTLISRTRAPALEERPPSRAFDAGPDGGRRQSLEFDAPWGDALPELPSEVFDDPAGSAADGRSTDVMAAQTDSFSARVDAATARSPGSAGAATQPPSPPAGGDDLAALSAGWRSEKKLTLPAGPAADQAAVGGPARDAKAPVNSRSAAVEPDGPPALFGEPPAATPAASARGWAMTSGSAGASGVPPSETLRNERTPVSLGPLLDYEHELESAASEQRNRRRSKISGARRRLALLALVLVLVAGGYLGKDYLAAFLGAARPAVPEAQAGLPAEGELRHELPETSEGLTASAVPTADSPASVESPEPPAGDPGSSVEPVARDLPSRASGRPASAILGISWSVSRRGTLVTIRLDGELERGRVVHDRLPWTPLKEQITLTGISNPYHPATIEVGSAELERLRTGLHAAAPAPELRLVFDFHVPGIELDVERISADRLEVLARRASP